MFLDSSRPRKLGDIVRYPPSRVCETALAMAKRVETPVEDQPKRMKTKTDVSLAEAKGTFTTWAVRMCDCKFKKATDEEKKEAERMLHTYRGLSKDMQAGFVYKFLDTKASKNFAWHRKFEDSLTATKKTEVGFSEKYRTRCCMQLI